MIVVNDLEEQGPYKISKAEFLKKTQATLNANWVVNQMISYKGNYPN